MKLTRKKAIEICIELWIWLAETGKSKEDWDGWERYGNMMCDCPLCEYSKQKVGLGYYRCKPCPITKQVGGDGSVEDCWKFGFKDWDNVKTERTRKKYAKIFLERLLEIK